MAMRQNPVRLVNIPIPTKLGKNVVHLPQNATIGLDSQPASRIETDQVQLTVFSLTALGHPENDLGFSGRAAVPPPMHSGLLQGWPGPSKATGHSSSGSLSLVRVGPNRLPNVTVTKSSTTRGECQHFPRGHAGEGRGRVWFHR